MASDRNGADHRRIAGDRIAAPDFFHLIDGLFSYAFRRRVSRVSPIAQANRWTNAIAPEGQARGTERRKRFVE